MRALTGPIAQSVELRTFNRESLQTSGTIPQDSAAFAESTTRNDRASDGSPPRFAAASGPTADELRRKLDRAIMAEQWEAVKTIRERIAEVERAQAGNVVDIDRARPRTPR
jgi:hypothetical protein